ncbi:hypothetical protein GALMADRAFT_1121259 [Galerina marginata CBS 339.88]|uniref:Uncharacterized protein n=1 Tax=Galerina marginata (strain CBS 339.88) TaxID=685588 RepID=A0A067TMC5_GALM3|nr:hypothetical protein GALMADRAFT_1121259 [Galerina marginata CBS 339.88]
MLLMANSSTVSYALFFVRLPTGTVETSHDGVLRNLTLASPIDELVQIQANLTTEVAWASRGEGCLIFPIAWSSLLNPLSFKPKGRTDHLHRESQRSRNCSSPPLPTFLCFVAAKPTSQQTSKFRRCHLNCERRLCSDTFHHSRCPSSVFVQLSRVCGREAVQPPYTSP